VFVDSSDSALTRKAIEAGVSAYFVDGMRPERIRPVLDAAIARFQMFQRMRKEPEAAKIALEERKVIDRAKGILMRTRRISEEDTYAVLRRTAMDKELRLVEVAGALVTAASPLS
jgi:response regulator NasT